MNKKLTTALLAGTILSSILFSTAPAFATPHEGPEQTQGPTLKGTDPLSYPAPAVTPNTVNGVVPETQNPTPAPATEAQEPATLPNTGVTELMWVWAGIGGFALAVGVTSVIYVRQKAKPKA